jgi:hypothetical protein
MNQNHDSESRVCDVREWSTSTILVHLKIRAGPDEPLADVTHLVAGLCAGEDSWRRLCQPCHQGQERGAAVLVRLSHVCHALLIEQKVEHHVVLCLAPCGGEMKELLPTCLCPILEKDLRNHSRSIR